MISIKKFNVHFLNLPVWANFYGLTDLSTYVCSTATTTTTTTMTFRQNSYIGLT